MLVVKIFGGLGNQMFQYATARAISLSSEQPLLMEIESGFEGDFYQRNYCLGHFTISAGVITRKELPGAVYGFSQSPSVFKRTVKNLYNHLVTWNWKIINEKDQYFDPAVFLPSRHMFLNGYWQSHKYFEKFRQVIQADFQLKCGFEGVNLSVAESMEQTNSISLHIRRLHGVAAGVVSGAHTEIHGALVSDYYEQAVRYISARVTNPVFYVFSDDIDWARNNLKLSYPVHFMDQNDDAHNYLDLSLMSKCKHQIIANSTFSWWGAWLNMNADKIVIAPKIWFVNKEMNDKTTDLFPDNWIRL